MGWASGSELAQSVIQEILPYIKDKDKTNVIYEILLCFSEHDCDTLDELQSMDNKYVDDALDKYWKLNE